MIAVLVPIHRILAFLADICTASLIHLEKRTSFLSITIALDQLIIMVLLSRVVGEGGFVVF